MKNKKKIYIAEVIILIFIIIFEILIKKNFFAYANYINIVFWLVYFIFLVIIFGFPKDKNYLKNSITKTVLIVLILYFILSYFVGLFTGFVNTIYAHDILSIIKNVMPIMIFDVILELVRFVILKKCSSNLQKHVLTILIIILDIIMVINKLSFKTGEQLFLIIATLLLPIIAREFLYTYITNTVGYTPTIVYRCIIDSYVFIVPFMPNLGNYLSSVMGILLPFIIYRLVMKSTTYKEKYNAYALKYFRKFSLTVFIVILVLFSGLISGFFKYQLIAIATDSMQNLYGRGDAVIFEKKKPQEIKVDDILVFKENGIIITHRVLEIKENNGIYSYVTKGDNNNTADNYNITNENVLGIVKHVVKYIGYPTVWLNN